MRISLFATCLANEFYAEACADAVRVLRHVGVDVDVPAGQTCCGQPAYNAGRRDDARRMAEHTLDVLSKSEYVVVPSGSCAGMVRCFYEELVDASRAEEAASLGEKTFELAQFLVDVLGVDQLGDGLAGQRVAYHHGCHALRELGVQDQPLRLLAGCGAEVVDWSADQECCGFGGLFSTKLPEVSASMADHKIDSLPTVDFVTSADGGCLLQLDGRARKRADTARSKDKDNGGPPFRHLASVLWEGVGR